MKVENLIHLLAVNTPYSIILADNPRLIWWHGRGNKTPPTCKDDEIKEIVWTKKGIIIYV